MSSKHSIAVLALCIFSTGMLFGQASDPFPPRQLPAEIYNIAFHSLDFPQGIVFQKSTLSRDPIAGGWDSKVSFNPADIVQGQLDSWKIGDTGLVTKYGYFASPLAAQSAANSSIYYAAYPLEYHRKAGTFSGSTLGDVSFYWDISFERVRVSPPIQKAALSFAKGRYAFLTYAYTNGSSIDKKLLEVIATRAERKVNVAIAFDHLSSALPTLIHEEGVLRSLQVKVDHFIQNYRGGDYKGALNNINSFLKELSAQRAKHVAELAFQSLQSDAESIIQSLNELLTN